MSVDWCLASTIENLAGVGARMAAGASFVRVVALAWSVSIFIAARNAHD